MLLSFGSLVFMRAGYFFATILFLSPIVVLASVEITEIMYDLEGADSGREWVEVYNSGAEAVNMTGWRFYEAGINHKISLYNENDDFLIPAGGYAIIADSPDKCRADQADYSGILFDSCFSLINTGELLGIRNEDLVDMDTVDYSSEWGANGNGYSLQKTSSEWIAALSTPGGPTLEPDLPRLLSGQSDAVDYIPPEQLPSIEAYAGEDKTIVAGALAEFRGQAFGLKGAPLKNARYLWNFGDGTTKEGQNITHFYRYPGEYVVVLDVASGGYSASDRLIARVVPNKIFISELRTGPESFVELKNDSDSEINISGWRLRGGDQTFTFPGNTFIRASDYLVIGTLASGMSLPQGNGKVELLYPGGFLADLFEYKGVLKKGESFVRDSALEVYVTSETPGEENREPELTVQIAASKPSVPAAPSGSKQIVNGNEANSASATSADPVVAAQPANTVAIVGSENSNKTLFYFLIALGLSFFSALAVFLIRRQSRL
jgi:PKD repeat protein